MRRVVVAVMAALALPALAQHHGYAGMKHREIKALSPEQVTQYQAGAGMGYAMPAELNRFPGPMHVLELADKLQLTSEQRAKTQALMDAHKAEARAIGVKRVESERALEALFRSCKVDEAALAKQVRDAAALEGAELVRIRAPERFHDFHTPLSRQLARAVPLERPAIWFVRDTRQRPAFDAEAIGRGNSRTRPELTDTVWVTRGTRELAIAIAHELAHVLMDSGEYSQEPGNLMREETAPGSTGLSPAQCTRMRDTARANGLLR